ncbi:MULTISPECIES: DNA circularization protein [unclassified Sphingobium]|uniref:DNA circularization protein n=1 Tax=unclassified Sphingobium TaxID=2611147 RepID=UPI0035A582A6
MSAPDGWQKGSFRGVPFRTEDHETSGGRRGVNHEFPQAEKPVWEDLGRGARSYRIECHVVGADYPAGANALADALDQPGAGTLVHPWLGAMQVAVPEQGWSRRDSATDDGGIARFSIEFVESGLPVPATATSDTQAQATAAADEAAAAAPIAAARGINVASAIGFVQQAADDVVKYAALAVQAQAALSGGIGPTLSFLTSNLGLLGDAGALLREPLELGLTVVRTVQTLTAIAGGGSGGARAARALMDFGGDLDVVAPLTPARAQQAENQAAIVQLVNLAASAELVRCLAGIDFASYDDAVAARDGAVERLDALALRQADAHDDAGAAQYDALARAVTVDLTARGASLERLRSFTPAATEPVLVIAQRLYGDPANVEAQASDIVARNRIRHPGFVPGGRTLQLLGAEARYG